MKTTTLTPEIIRLYAKLRHNPPFMLTGRNAEMCWRGARTIARFRELESTGLVRLLVEPEQENYFNVYGVPDDPRELASMEASLERDGCWWTCTEYRTDPDDEADWEHADSCGMHTGYRDPGSPFENCYVVDEMATAVEAYNSAIAAQALEASERHLAACRDMVTV
jgi:hypothetical protein